MPVHEVNEEAVLVAVESAPCAASFPVPFRLRRLVGPCLALLVSALTLPHAPKVWHFTHHWLRVLPLDSFFSTTTQLVSYTMIALIALMVWIQDPPRRRCLAYFAVCLILSGFASSALKQLAGRERPEWSMQSSEKHGDYGEGTLQTEGDSEFKPDGCDHWLLGRLVSHHFSDRYGSFPSGHATSAFALAAFLVALYPRAHLLWLVLAFGVALARVWSARHFPEDVLVGAALGWAVAWWVFSWRWPLALADRVAELSSSRRH